MSAESSESQLSQPDLGLDTSPLKRFGAYLALSALGIAQPLLDLLGSNPEVLSATKNTGTSAWLFVIGLLTLPAIVTAAIVGLASKVSQPAGQILHYAAVFGFCLLFMLALTRTLGLGPDALAYLVALAGAGGLLYLQHRVGAVRQIVLRVAFLPLALLGLFAFSASGAALRSPDPEAVISGRPLETPPIVFIVLDEFPLWTLLDTDGEIDAARLPGFADLAESSTFYRNTASPSNSTQTAVPAIMTGLRPREDAPPPFASIYPNSIFTLLGADYAINSYESTTSLCPESICDSPGNVGEGSTGSLASIKALIRDSSTVYGHRILPESTRELLPRIDLSWGNFADDAEPAGQAAAPSDADGDPWAKHGVEAVGGPARQFQILSDLVDQAGQAVEPTLTFYHGTVPHRPWVLTPNGDAYRATDEAFPKDSVGPDPDDPRDRYQRLLMMVAHTDLVLGEAINELKSAGTWEDSLVVLVADHGISLVPGESMRVVDITNDQSVQDIYRVPMFVKLPGQTSGSVTDCPALAIDLIPTIINVVGAKPGWELDGVDLAQCSESEPRKRLTSEIFGEPLVEVNYGQSELLDQIAHYGEWVDLSYGPDAFARVGRSAPLVGTVPESMADASMATSWTANELDLLAGVGNGSTPAQLTGTITLNEEAPPGTEGLILVDGVVAGVIVELGGSAAGEVTYSAILNPALITSPDAEVELAINHPDGTVSLVGVPVSTS